jgi:hypothetical protein
VNGPAENPPATTRPDTEAVLPAVELLVIDALNSTHVHSVTNAAGQAEAPAATTNAVDPPAAIKARTAPYSEIRQIAASMGVETGVVTPAEES